MTARSYGEAVPVDPAVQEVLDQVLGLTSAMPDGFPARRALEAWVASQALLIAEQRVTNYLLAELVTVLGPQVEVAEEPKETPHDRAMVPCRGCGHLLGSHREDDDVDEVGGCNLCDCRATP